MKCCLLLLVCCGASLAQLPPRGQRPSFLTTSATQPPTLPQVSAAPVVEDFYDEEAPPPPPPPPQRAGGRPGPVDDEPLAARVPEPLPPRPVPLRPAFRPAPTVALRKPVSTQPPLDEFPPPSRGATRTSPEPPQRGPPPGRQVPVPRPHQQYKKPVAQVIRKYREDNPDGSITWGFENDDGTFKEETIGVDCVVRGKYGYIDPDGVRREYTYNTGIPCDKRDSSGEAFALPNEDALDLESVVKNKARKPIPPTFRN